MLELYWLAALSALSGATLLVSCWTALRLRTRGVTGPFSVGATTSGAITEPHAHTYDTMLGDGKGWRCGQCGEPKEEE